MKQRKRKFWKGAILALAVAGLATPVAQGRPLSKWGTVIPAATQSGSQSSQFSKALVPSQLLRTLDATQYQQQTSPRPDDRSGFHGPGTVVAPGPHVVTVGGNGIDWNKAGLGAGIAIATATLLGGLAIARRRQPHVAV